MTIYKLKRSKNYELQCASANYDFFNHNGHKEDTKDTIYDLQLTIYKLRKLKLIEDGDVYYLYIFNHKGHKVFLHKEHYKYLRFTILR